MEREYITFLNTFSVEMRHSVESAPRMDGILFHRDEIVSKIYLNKYLLKILKKICQKMNLQADARIRAAWRMPPDATIADEVDGLRVGGEDSTASRDSQPGASGGASKNDCHSNDVRDDEDQMMTASGAERA